MLYALARNCDNRTLLGNSKRFVELAREQAAKMSDDDLDVEAYIEKYDDYLSQGAKKQIELAANARRLRTSVRLFDFCALVRAWLRDCLVTREGGSELLAYPECADQTSQIARLASIPGLLTGARCRQGSHRAHFV